MFTPTVNPITYSITIKLKRAIEERSQLIKTKRLAREEIHYSFT